MSKLVLIDGSSYLYRAFHALPPLSNAAGEPTGALFGVVNMLRTTLKERPDYAAFVIDAPGKTFRDALDSEYKMHRPPMPDDLRMQVEPMRGIVHALGIDILCIDGVEADDVIGTLALAAVADGIAVTISTGDKDFAQLVRPGVELVNTMTGSRMDSAMAVINKFGVAPDQIIDFLALMGDSVDNVPGVDKCGPKTAAKWLAEYGSLDAVIANADKIKGKIGDNLRVVLPRLLLNRALITIKTDVVLEKRPQDLALRERDTEALRDFYRRYGFTQALKELDGGSVAVTVAEQEPGRGRNAGFHVAPDASVAMEINPALSAPGEYETIFTIEQLQDWIVRLRVAGQFALDTETDSLDPMQAVLIGLSFASEVGCAAYLPFGHDYPGAPVQLDRGQALALLQPLLEDAAVRKVGQHGKYDMHVLRRYGIVLAGYADDTLLESFVLTSGHARHDMDTLARRHLGYETMKYVDLVGKGAKQIPFSHVGVQEATQYAAEDADITLRLHCVLAPKLLAEPRLERVYREIEMPLVAVLERIEANGVQIDAEELYKQSADLSRRMVIAQQKAMDLAGRHFNLDSPKQLQVLLFDELKLPVVVKTPKGQPSTNEEALEAIVDQHALPRVILEYRSLAKLRNTYTEKLPEMIHPHTGRVHTNYHQAGAATGRLSSSDPNLQNIPIRTDDGRRIRRAFVAPSGRKLIACDYSQIELRIMAHLSGDAGLVDAFESGVDVHCAIAAEVFGRGIDEVTPNERRAAKAINFGLIYGMSAFGLARQLGISRGEAQDYIALYFDRFSGVRDFMENTRQQARDRGYVETVFGRRLYLNSIASGNQTQRAGAERAAINAPMQGTAADIIKRAMVAVDGWLGVGGHRERALMILQVHDELVFEADEGFVPTLVHEVSARMAAAAQLRVPLVVDVGVGHHWDEAH